jgi:uncharacterized membrane protein
VTADAVRSGQVRAALVVLGTVTFAFGTWAFVAPHSFFMTVAHFEPYNRHFTHDAGALQIGVGVSLLMAAWIDSTAVAVLGGFVVFQVAHVASHLMDRDLGGRPWLDIPFLGVQALVGVGALRSVWPANRAGTSRMVSGRRR